MVKTIKIFLMTISLFIGVTALAQSGDATEAPDDITNFELTATQLIVQATQSAQAPFQLTVTPTADPFEARATQFVIVATLTAEAGQPFMPQTAAGNADSDQSALGLTVMIFGLLIFALIILGSMFILVKSRQDEKRKIG